MANNIKGITVEIGGDTGPLTSALKGVNKTASELQSELREVNKQLKFDPKNTTLLTQKIDILKQSTQTLEEKQKTLKKAVQDAHDAFDKGDLGSEKVRAVEREYEKVNSQLKDTKKNLAAAESEAGTFTEKVKGKFSELKGKIKDTFSADNIKTALGAVGVAVGGFLKGSLDEAKDAEKADADLEQTLKSTKGAAGMTKQSLDELSESLSKNTTFSKDEVKSGESMLLTFTNIGKDVFPQATSAVLDFAQKMGTDPKQAALQLGKALNDPATGLSKLTKSGVTFTEAQKKQITAMQKAGDTAGAQKLMIAELNKEFGGQAAAAADTYAGKQKQVGNELKEVKETIGTALMPVLANLLKSVTPIIQSAANFVSKNPQLTAAILAVIAVVGTLVGGMQLLTTVTAFFGLAADASLAPILPAVLAVTAAVVGLSAAAIGIATHWKQVSAVFTGLWNTIKGAFSGIGQWFSTRFSEAANGVKSAWNGAGNWFSNIGKGIQNAFNGTINFIKNNWKSLALFLVNPIAGAVSLLYNNNPKFKAWADSLMNSIKSAFTSAWNSIVSFFTQSIPQFIASAGQWFQQLPYNIGYALGAAIADIINFGTSAWNWVTTQLPQIINGIIQWFAQLPGRIWAFLVQTVTSIGTWGSNMQQSAVTGASNTVNAVGTWFSQLPGKIWAWLVSVVTKIGTWGTNMHTAAMTAATNTINAVVSWFQQLPGRIWNFLVTIVTNAGTWGTNLYQTVSNASQTVINGVITWFSQLPGKMLDIGKNIVTGIWNGISGAVSWLHDQIAGFCKGIVDGIKSHLKIHSPSQVLADEVGKFMALGIGQGFTDNMKSVVQAMTAAIPTSFDSSVQVRTAMTAAYGGYSASVPAGARSSAESAGSTQDSTEGVKVYQYFQGKTPSPAEHARLTRNGLQQVVKKLKG